jgi:hypothetical protein
VVSPAKKPYVAIEIPVNSRILADRTNSKARCRYNRQLETLSGTISARCACAAVRTPQRENRSGAAVLCPDDPRFAYFAFSALTIFGRQEGRGPHMSTSPVVTAVWVSSTML